MNTVATRQFNTTVPELAGGAKVLPTQSADGVQADCIMVIHGINAYIVPDAVDGDVALQVTTADGNILFIVGKYFFASQSDTLAVNFNGIPCWRQVAGVNDTFKSGLGGTPATPTLSVYSGVPTDGHVTVYYSWVPRAQLMN